ncbi:aspartyl/asparaginyl beta-hydroxylase domain-containing protein [Thalassotalea sp. PLHSN55]|uniref:aspartyl/asparaginyl beta-hydroxylase domain-containing protein n=1 Tax=Thalassotalea sp. PLHSN55 TaxID=3435888 RepID=UPI003F8757B1
MSAIIYSALLPLQVNLHVLQQEVSSLLSEHWVDHVNTSCYQGSWDVLPIKTLAKNLKQHPILQSFSLEEQGDWQYLPIIKKLPYLQKMLDSLPCSAQAVRLMRLKANAYIKPHQDKGLSMTNAIARLHLPIFASEQVEFTVHEKIIPMKNGQLWYINADALHSVKHIGSEDRINLVIDCQANDWLKQAVCKSNSH